MSIFARLMASGDRGGMEQRSLLSSSFVPPPQVGVIDDFVGVHRAMAHMTVFACVRLLADTIASLPWKVYRRDTNGMPKEVKPQPALVRQPWPGFDLFQWKWMCVASMALRGNSYHMVTSRDKSGNPTALLPLHPDIVYLERRPDILEWFKPTYRVMGEAIPAGDMVHMRRFTMPGEPWGLSPVRQAAVAIGMGLSAEEYGYRYFKESANPSGTLSTDLPLDDEAIKRTMQNWIQSHGGRRLPAILTGGFKWTNLTISPDESQFLETRQFQRSEICLMFGVPPILIGDTKETTAWGTGVEQITLGAVTYTFRPWTSCIESVINNCLPNGQFVKFDYSALLRGDFAGQLNALKTAIQGTEMTPNEARATMEMDPVDGGDQLLVPPGYMTAKAVASLRPTPPAPPKDKPGSGTGTLPMPPTSGGENNPSASNRSEAESVHVSGNGHQPTQIDMFMGEIRKEMRVASPGHGKPNAMLSDDGRGSDDRVPR